MSKRKKNKPERTTFDVQMENLERQQAASKRKTTNADRSMIKTTVYMYEDQWKLLDRRAAQSKTDENDGVGRAEILRSLLDFFIELRPDMTTVSSEEELVELIKTASSKS